MGALGEKYLIPWEVEEVRTAANKSTQGGHRVWKHKGYIVNVLLYCITAHGKIALSVFLYFMATMYVRADCDQRHIGTLMGEFRRNKISFTLG